MGARAAWVLLGSARAPLASRLDGVCNAAERGSIAVAGLNEGSDNRLRPRAGHVPGQLLLARIRRPATQGAAVNDLLYVAITIIVFALFFLLVKGVEKLER